MLYSVGMQDALPEVATLPDEEVLSLSLKHPSVFAELVRRFEAPFLRKAQSIIRDEEEARDIVQEAFVKIYLNASRFKTQEGATFSSWGYRILINTALTHYAKRKREGAHTAQLDEEIWQLVPDKNLRQFEKKELTDEIASVLVRMPPLFARVLTAFFIEGKPQEQIAQEEGVSVGAIKTRVHRAKREFERIYKSLTNANV